MPAFFYEQLKEQSVKLALRKEKKKFKFQYMQRFEKWRKQPDWLAECPFLVILRETSFEN